MKDEISKIVKSKLAYPIQMEVEAPFAMFARADTGSEKTSYPVPTFSASKGMFESIVFMPSVIVIPTKVQVCKKIQYYRYTFNYRGSIRKGDLISEENAKQIRYNILTDVCYKLFALVINNDKYVFSSELKKYKNINNAHSYQSQFNRRLRRGQNNEPPFMGLSEFLPSYVGIFRDSTQVKSEINFTIPSLLFTCWSSLSNGKWNPTFIQNVEIKNGELNYVE